jgi:hypothetical protein
MGTIPDDPIVALARKRAAHYHRHHTMLWAFNNYCKGIADTLTIVVPFGLAAMLWVPENLRQAFNIGTLACSGLAALFQFVPSGQRVRERALLLRRLYKRLEFGIGRFESGDITREQLMKIFEEAEESHLHEDGP